MQGVKLKFLLENLREHKGLRTICVCVLGFLGSEVLSTEIHLLCLCSGIFRQ
jgi:hypothetical protein